MASEQRTWYIYLYFSTSFPWFERLRSEAEDKQESQMECQIFVRCLKTVLHSEVFMKCPISGHSCVVSHCHDRKLQDANDFSQMQGVALESFQLFTSASPSVSNSP